jgi:regulator of cell morphogenesis and NO signaling
MKQIRKISSDSKLAELIVRNNFLLFLLEHLGISIPVYDKKVKEICEEYNINEELFIAFLNLYCGKTSIPEFNLNPNEVITIIDFLRTSHRFYSEKIYPQIMQLIEEMNQLNNHKEMKLVSQFFADYFKEVMDHLEYENKVFHPYVIQLVEHIKANKRTETENNYTTIEYRDHHDDIEEKLIDLKNLLIKYLPTDEDRIVRRRLFFLLTELEFDLKIHSNIEELILIPFTIRLEKIANKLPK